MCPIKCQREKLKMTYVFKVCLTIWFHLLQFISVRLFSDKLMSYFKKPIFFICIYELNKSDFTKTISR